MTDMLSFPPEGEYGASVVFFGADYLKCQQHWTCLNWMLTCILLFWSLDQNLNHQTKFSNDAWHLTGADLLVRQELPLLSDDGLHFTRFEHEVKLVSSLVEFRGQCNHSEMLSFPLKTAGDTMQTQSQQDHTYELARRTTEEERKVKI